MKKKIIAALTMLTLGSTQAEYTLQIPLEESRGGSLPSGSIQLRVPSSALPPQPPEPSEPPVCSFSLSSPITYWFVVGTLESISYETGIYNDMNITVTPDVNGKYPSTVTFEGNSYSRGSYVMESGGETHVYEMCISH